MRKIIALTLASLMVISVLCGCGGSEVNTSTQTKKDEPEESISTLDQNDESEDIQVHIEETTEPEAKTITFDDLLIAEDDYISVELVDFQEDINFNYYIFNIRVHNKTDRKIDVGINTGEAYVDDEAINLTLYNSGSLIAPGKKAVLSFATMDEGALESLEKLYGLEGRLSYSIFSADESTIADRGFLDFVLPQQN